jgi:t-SNARE complex subunit (syntaxin)
MENSAEALREQALNFRKTKETAENNVFCWLYIVIIIELIVFFFLMSIGFS